ncbi:ATP-binding protein [Streptomyces marincola]|uniref:ATP-binding protein n=1 Tax=Streptomyces marincola TaxID=2878388 RepID=UPI00131E8187|nr:AAA family ATPase [Streptomyces marincola]
MHASDPLGREHSAGLLRAEIDRTADSHGGLVLVAGEAGIGKTTLVTSALGHARARGALVLAAACWEHGGSPGYWPWMQVVRALRRAAGPGRWPALAETSGPGLAALLGESGGEARSAPGAGPGGDGERPPGARDFLLHDAVTDLLLSAAQWRPVVVVVEDLHWADAASVRLLQFLVRHTWSERVLVIGTYRDDAAEGPQGALPEPLLARARVLALTGLGPEAVARLMARTTGKEPDGGTAAEVHRRTGGNPFFVEQTARLWAQGSPVDEMAPGVRWTLEQRLARLPADLAAFLSAAAVLGQAFWPRQPAAVLGVATEDADALVARAVAARLVAPLDGGRFGFAHDLIREALYARFDPAGLRRAHAAALRALRRDPDEVPLPADLARHAVAAGDEVPAAETVEYLLAAARDAVGRLAMEEAVGHYGRAREAVPAREVERRALVTLDLAAARYALGDATGAHAAFGEVLILARELRDDQLLARAALTLHALRDPGRHDPLLVDAVREAHEALAGGSGPASGATAGGVPLDRRAQELSLRAVQLARRSGDDLALGFGLLARHDAIWSPRTTAERRALSEELLGVARRRGDLTLELQAAGRRLGALLEVGDPRFLDEHRAFAARAEQSGAPRDRDEAWLSRCAVATLTGRFEDAEEIIGNARAGGEQVSFDRASLWRHQAWALSLARGGSGPEAGGGSGFESGGRGDRNPGAERGDAGAGLAAALTAVQRGDVNRAVRYLRACEADGVRHPVWFAPLWLRFQAQTAALAGDAARCRSLRAELAPLEGNWAVSIAGYDVHGPYLLWASVLDAALGRWDAAVAGLTEARRAAGRLGALPWSVEATLRLAGALAARRGRGDAERAAALFDEARRDATALGMARAAERAAAGLGGPAPRRAAGRQAPPGGAGAGDNLFRLRDGAWTLRFSGRTVHVPDAKGLHDLRRLLARPGAEVPAVRLHAPAGDPPDDPAGGPPGPAPGPPGSGEAARRLEAVERRIARALAAGRDAEAAEADRERAALLADLAAGGPAGRREPAGEEAERARKAVSGRIRYVLRRLGALHPELAGHLGDSVTTGHVCAYRPDPPVEWTL